MSNTDRPSAITDKEARFDAFDSGKVLLGKKKNHLPAMGWNSWNAFGSGNTEALTKAMADAIVDLGLKDLGYSYVVLDDGCYKPVRIDGKVSNEEEKFPSGFKKLADYIHERGLKFGMYNDIGTNLCAGAAVGTCGHEDVDAKCYVDWNVDFLKVDNCYYLWDNATFSDAGNARFVYAPNIKKIQISGPDTSVELSAVGDGKLVGDGASFADDYATFIGTFDGTGPDHTPVGMMSGELNFNVKVATAGDYKMIVTYATDKVVGCGNWLQIAVGCGKEADVVYDDFVPDTESATAWTEKEFTVRLKAGENVVRLMNHRRQENTLDSYAALLAGLNKADPNHDIILSICEWGKTQPQNWGYKVGDSWRILNDITFAVGADGDPGKGTWNSDYTCGLTSQYNKAVIMGQFAGLDKGWNDPDMLMIGMNGLDMTQCRTHMAMWCMMNSPLMLGLDLRRVKKGDEIYNIIANKDLIALNQDALGKQATRIYCSKENENPDTTYVRDNDRVDVLAKPLADGSVALSFINVSDTNACDKVSVNLDLIRKFLGNVLEGATEFEVTNLWTKETVKNVGKVFGAIDLAPCDNVTIKISPAK